MLAPLLWALTSMRKDKDKDKAPASLSFRQMMLGPSDLAGLGSRNRRPRDRLLNRT